MRTVSRNVVFTEFISLKSRKWLLFVSRRSQKCGLISFGRIPLTFSEALIFLFVLLNVARATLQTLRLKSVDVVEAWSPRQKKYFEVGSCSNLTDAQARRLKIRVKGENGNYLAHTLNNGSCSSENAYRFS